jgi:hypothetical protein
MKKYRLYLCACLILLARQNNVVAQTKSLRLQMHTRDSVTNQVTTKTETISTKQIGIVIVDPWNYHWCMTWTEQVGGMVPRMNRALDAARKLGIEIMWAPTDVASMYSAWPQRQRAMATPYIEVPSRREYSCNFTIPWGDCLCGPGYECRTNYGWDGIDPRLTIAQQDLIVAGTKELYSVCKARGITHLIYFGGATNICLTGKPEGLSFMYGGGLETIFAKDMAFAWSAYKPAESFTPSKGNEQAADDLERAGIPTMLFGDELKRQGLWNNKWITEPVRITPAGAVNRPYFFDTTVTVTLEAPYLKDPVIRYTLDGSAPTPISARYTSPVRLFKTTTLRTAVFNGKEKISFDGQAFFVLLPPKPPKPEILLSAVKPVPDLYGSVNEVYAACLWQPVPAKSYEGKKLRIREHEYENGLGLRAPAYARVELNPEWKRFVALVGVDDNMIDVNLGRNIAMYSKMKFQVFIDGALAAESPVMRISQEPWRFNISIPAGSRQLTVVCDDLGEKSPYNLGNVVEAGFCRQ